MQTETPQQPETITRGGRTFKRTSIPGGGRWSIELAGPGDLVRFETNDRKHIAGFAAELAKSGKAGTSITVYDLEYQCTDGTHDRLARAFYRWLYGQWVRIGDSTPITSLEH